MSPTTEFVGVSEISRVCLITYIYIYTQQYFLSSVYIVLFYGLLRVLFGDVEWKIVLPSPTGKQTG